MNSEFPLIIFKEMRIKIQITNQSQWDFIYGCQLIESRKHAMANYLTSMIEKVQVGQELSLQMKLIDSFLQNIRLNVQNVRLE